jgi:two-component system CheB/CheR fusion protein
MNKLPVSFPSQAKMQKPSSKALKKFPIIGVGASAGGLEAIEQFICNVPVDSGIAFIIVQHQDPNHQGVLCELLQRITALKVLLIRDHMTVQPNNVYVIPAGYDLSILNGVLYLLEPVEPRGLRLPIDYFFRSLAADQQERSIGVILSGMGTDGTLGLRAIKHRAGAGFVQSLTSAKFDSMPRSAIDAGLADVVAPSENLLAKILTYLKHIPLLSSHSNVAASDADQSGLEKVVILLRAQTGHDFSLYKKSTVYRRIERRMALHQLIKIVDYVRYLRANPQEGELLFKELLIGVTSFFRDPEVWKQLGSEVIPELFTIHPEGGTLRAWVPACSTGEEAYTLAMVFREVLEHVKPKNHYSLQVFATDLDGEAINNARAGVYPSSIRDDVPKSLLNRYFVEEDGAFRVGKEIREMVIFAPQNLVMDPPFTKLDMLTCRNLLIYLETDLQKKLLPLFHYSLNPGGVLLLGSAETIGNATTLFSPFTGKSRLYRRRENVQRPDIVEFPAVYSGRLAHEPQASNHIMTVTNSVSLPNLQQLTDALLLQRFTPSAVLTTDKGDIVYINGKTGNYLEPAAGKVNNNLFAMAREGLTGPLNEAFTRAVRQGQEINYKNIKVSINGSIKMVDVSIHPLNEPIAMRDMVLVVFIDKILPTTSNKSPNKAKNSRVQAGQLSVITKELQRSREDLQTTREEMQTSQEELKSTNEELQSTNEELQSTNEELTTSKEEMQSMNEELQTVNHELTAKVDELSQASDDMKNLLNSTDIATLFLDNELKVRRFTDQTTNIIKLIPGDAGRPITDLVTTLEYPELVLDAREVLRTLIFHEKQVATNDLRWFTVRIMPYRTQDNHIDGVVITFTNITVSKQAVDALFNSRQMLLTVLDNIPQRVFWKDINSVFLGANKPFIVDCGYFDIKELVGKTDHQTASASMADGYISDDNLVMTSGKSKLRYEEQQVRSNGKKRWISTSKVPLTTENGVVTGILGTYEDITERKQAEHTLREQLAALQQRFDSQAGELQQAQVEIKQLKQLKQLKDTP